MRKVRLNTYLVLHQPHVYRGPDILGEVEATSKARALNIAKRKWARNADPHSIKVRRKSGEPRVLTNLSAGPGIKVVVR